MFFYGQILYCKYIISSKNSLWIQIIANKTSKDSSRNLQINSKVGLEKKCPRAANLGNQEKQDCEVVTRLVQTRACVFGVEMQWDRWMRAEHGHLFLLM